MDLFARIQNDWFAERGGAARGELTVQGLASWLRARLPVLREDDEEGVLLEDALALELSVVSAHMGTDQATGVLEAPLDGEDELDVVGPLLGLGLGQGEDR